MPLNIKPQPRRFYLTNCLKLVICQLRFPVIHRFEQPGFLGAFQDALKKDYPRGSLEQQIGVALTPAGATSVPPSQFWRFTDSSGAWSVAVARDFVSLETTAYERFEGFRDRLQSLLDALPALGVDFQERLGLRFVNEIKHPKALTPASWRGFLNEDLLGMVGGDVLGDGVIHAVQEIRLREEDGILVIRHGYVGTEPTDNRPYYLLDLDYYDEVGKPLDREHILQRTETYHSKMHDVFEMSITDAMREHLGIRSEVGV
jgi:uncharacterized protein (TIGR04255 family)